MSRHCPQPYLEVGVAEDVRDVGPGHRGDHSASQREGVRVGDAVQVWEQTGQSESLLCYNVTLYVRLEVERPEVLVVAASWTGQGRECRASGRR